MNDPRHDIEFAAFVDYAIILSEQRGTRLAAAFLQSRHVSSDLIFRVLYNPARRRPPSRIQTIFSHERLTGSAGGQVGLDVED